MRSRNLDGLCEESRSLVYTAFILVSRSRMFGLGFSNKGLGESRILPFATLYMHLPPQIFYKKQMIIVSFFEYVPLSRKFRFQRSLIKKRAKIKKKNKREMRAYRYDQGRDQKSWEPSLHKQLTPGQAPSSLYPQLHQ